MDTQAIVSIVQYDVEQCDEGVSMPSQEHHQSDPNVDRHLKPLTMDQAVEDVCWVFLQKGPAVRTLMAKHPLPTRNHQFVMDINGGKKIRKNISCAYDKPVTNNHQEITAPVTKDNYWHHEWRMNKKRKPYTWYTHQPVCQEGRPVECSYEDCPGRLRLFDREGTPRAPRPYESRYKCLQCSIVNKKGAYYCNQIPRGV